MPCLRPRTHAEPASPAEIWTALRGWYATPLGTRLLRAEQTELDRLLPDLFGYHLLQIGRLPENLSRASRISHTMVLDVAPLESAEPVGKQRFYGLPEALPVCTDSIDVLLLPHVLEFAAAPHAVLREAERALIPEGHLVVVGFNPWSLGRLSRLVSGWRGTLPWCGRFYSTARVRDWLALLGLEEVATRHFFLQPALHGQPGPVRTRLAWRAGRMLWPVFGLAYIMVARKRVTTLTPIRPRWRARRRFAPAGVPSPE